VIFIIRRLSNILKSDELLCPYAMLLGDESLFVLEERTFLGEK